MDKLDFFSYFSPLFIYSAYWLFVFAFYLVRKERNYTFVKAGFLIFLMTNVLALAAWAFNQYLGLSLDPLGRYYLPPYSGYLFEKITGHINSAVISALIAFAFYLVIFAFARKTREEIIDAFDTVLIGLGLLIIGWPNLFIFLGLIFAFTLLGGLLTVIIKRRGLTTRFIITPYLPLAFLITLWFGPYLSSFIGLDKISF